MFEKQPHTDGGEVAVGHLLVSQHPLEEPLQVGLRGLQALTTPGQISYVWSPLSKTNTHRNCIIASVLLAL